VQNKIISIIGQILNVFFLLLINRFFYQEFGLFFLGLYNVAVIFTQFLLIFSDFGISSGLTNYISKHKHSDRDYVIKIAQSGLFISLLIFIILFIFVNFFLHTELIFSYLNIQNLDNYSIIFYLIIGMLIAIPRNQLGSILMGFNLPHIWSYLNLFTNFLNLIGLFFTLYFGFNDNIIGYVYIITNFISLLLFVFFVSSYGSPKIFFIYFHFNEFKKILNFSTKIYIGSLISFFSSFIDRILVFSLISINFLGIYSIIHNVSQKIEIIGSSVATTIFPELASNISDSKDKFIQNTKEWIEFSNFFSLNFGVFLFFISDYIYYFIFDIFPDFKIKILFLIILFSYLAKSISNLVLWIISSMNKPEVQIYYGVINFITYIILILIYYKNISINIIAFAFLLSNVITLFFLIYFLANLINKNYIFKIFLDYFFYLIFSFTLIFIIFYFVYLQFSFNYSSILTFVIYFILILFIIVKTDFLKTYKNNQIIKFILLKLKMIK